MLLCFVFLRYLGYLIKKEDNVIVYFYKNFFIKIWKKFGRVEKEIV